MTVRQKAGRNLNGLGLIMGNNSTLQTLYREIWVQGNSNYML